MSFTFYIKIHFVVNCNLHQNDYRYFIANIKKKSSIFLVTYISYLNHFNKLIKTSIHVVVKLIS